MLLTSLGATVLGWVAFSTGEPPVESRSFARHGAKADPGRARAPHERTGANEAAPAERWDAAGDATEAGVSGARDAYAPIVTTMLHEHHFRAMNTGVGVWVWSTDAERMSMIRAGMRWAEESLCRRRSGIESLPQHLRAQPIEPRRRARTASGLAHALDRSCGGP